MTRNLKALGLALFAVLAMSAFAASAAQAVNGVLTTGATPSTHTATTLIGEQYALSTPPGIATENHFTAFGSRVSCTNVTYTATSTGTDKTFTVTPDYSHCGVIATDDTLKPPATVTMNGCDYKFTQPVKLPAGEYTSKVDLQCPTGTGPVVHVAAGGTYTSHIGNLCTIEVTAGQELGHVILENRKGPKKDDVTATIRVTNIHAIRTGLCTGSEHTTNIAELTSNVTLTSKDETHDVWISDEE